MKYLPVTEAKRGAGRPSKLTDEAGHRMVALVRQSNFFAVACRACGIAEQTGYNWKERGQKEAERVESGEVPNEREARYMEFYLALDQADALAEVEDIRDIRSGFPDWRCRAWIRERKSFERWGNKQRLEHAGGYGRPIESVVRVVDA